MSKIFDITDWKVTKSDNAETYAVFEKTYRNEDEGFTFLNDLDEYVEEQLAEGTAKFFPVSMFGTGLKGYLPLVAFKHKNCADYNEDGEFEGDEDDEVDDIVAYDCIRDIRTYSAYSGLRVRMELVLIYFSPKRDNLDEIKKETTISVCGEGF